MGVFDAERKPGFSVGIEVVVVDEEGNRISNTSTANHGWTLELANQQAFILVDLVEKKLAEAVKIAPKPKR